MSNPALSELNPIIAAPDATWWPLAPGWYVLAFITIALSAWLITSAIKGFRRRRIKRAALRSLTPGLAANEINLLLKQACIGYYPRKYVAQLSGPAWREFLLQHLSARKAANYYDLLVEVEQTAYRPATAQTGLQQRYHDFAKIWLQQALPPSKAQRRPTHD